MENQSKLIVANQLTSMDILKSYLLIYHFRREPQSGTHMCFYMNISYRPQTQTAQ